MHLLFDLDGTLTDPKLGIVSCIQYALGRLNIEIVADTPLESYIGPPIHHSLRKLCGDDRLAQSALLLYRERYAETGLFENELYAGITECLKRVSDVADSVHVATSKPTV